MIKTAEGLVKQIIYKDSNVTKIIVLIETKEYNCINYNFLTGDVQVGDQLLLNITAIELQLGTGGFHFVIANLNRPKVDNLANGHIMKLKYTPFQINCITAETQESQYHDIFNDFSSLEGMPVIVGSLHSILAPCCTYLKHIRPDIRICYIMSEGGALPLHISEIVKKLKQEKMIDGTVTYGNAFGGDYECVNVYTALITAKEIVKADIAIISMGPGIVGTDTKLGFSGAEQGGIGDAVNRLGGHAVIVPRISFADKRDRHFGISHHSITVLKQLCCTKVNVAVPLLKNSDQMCYLEKQLSENSIDSLHNIYYVDCDDIDAILNKNSGYLQKMGKFFEEDKEYFITCAASAKLCLKGLS
ncbi:MAG: hypothetical protein A2Y23_12620 [Clostridiales bacterium GWB2_37_7]|nr:MAG: hypothetical protein A2Y23_12620 [Clostridiales bacterium GWB2_37_7]